MQRIVSNRSFKAPLVALATLGLLAHASQNCSSCISHQIHPKAVENATLCAEYLQLGKLQEAEARCNIAREYGPNYADPLNLLGLIERMRGRSEKAMDLFKQALSLNDDFAEAHNNIGGEFFERREYDAACRAFQSALEIDPGYIDARRNLATSYLYLGDIKHAFDEYLKCVELDPNNCECRNGLGVIAKQREDFDETRSHFQKLVQICPNDPKAWYNLGWVEFKTGRCNQAVNAFVSALALDKNLLEARHSLVKAYECLAMSDAAILKYIERLKKNPGYANDHYKLGLVYKDKQLYEQALSEFLNTIKLDKEHKPAYYHAAQVYDRMLRKDETIGFCKQFVALIKDKEHAKEKAWCVQRVKVLEFE